MIEELKKLIQNRKETEIENFLRKYPAVMNEIDDNGISTIMHLAYQGMNKQLVLIKEMKETYNYYDAIICGELNAVKSAIKNDSSLLNSYSSDGFSAIALASFFEQVGIVEYLIDQGADPSLPSKNKMKVAAIHAAVAKNNTTLCKYLLEHGAEVNAVQMQSITPLHSAVHRNNEEMIELLLSHGADPSLKTEDGKTALDIAKEEGNQNVVYLLSARD